MKEGMAKRRVRACSWMDQSNVGSILLTTQADHDGITGGLALYLFGSKSQDRLV
jgi:hypothetical protein